METIIEQITKSHKFPTYYLKIHEFYEKEKRKREEFYEKITPNEKVEFINGEIVMQSPARNSHLEILNNLTNIFCNYVEIKKLGKVRIEKALICLKRNDFEPDLCFFKKEKSDFFEKNTLKFPAPDFVIEIISKSTEGIDRGIKFLDYAENQIPEYWLIDPDNETIEQYLLFENEYKLVVKKNDGKIKCNQIENLEFSVRAIFDIAENLKFLKSIL